MLGGLNIHELLLRLPVVLFALTIHELMHAWSAYKCGDDTAYRLGRVTLNPLAHLDLWGTLALMFAPIGWAKPVQVNPYNFRHPRRDNIIVSGAGVAANFTLAAVLGLLARGLAFLGHGPETMLGATIWTMLGLAIILNFGLFIFNLLPIPPLDGSHILEELLPWRLREAYMGLRRYGVFLLLGVVFLNRMIASNVGFSPLFLPPRLLAWLFAGGDGMAEIGRAFGMFAAGA